MTEYFDLNGKRFVESHTLLPPFKTPTTGNIKRFKFDHELYYFDFKSRVVQQNYKDGALPATVKLDGSAEFDFMPLSRGWQELWFELLVWQAGGTMTHDQLLEAWRSTTMDSRALTDQHSRENGYRDYILGVNMTGKDMCQRRLSMAGNIGDYLYGTTFKALDMSRPAPRIDYIWGNHTLVWWAAESDRPYWYNGNRQDVNGRWPQLGKLGVPFLNLSPDGKNVVKAEAVAPLANNIEFSPYYP